MALSTVSLWFRRIGLGKRSRLEAPEPPNRYERRRPGELVHVDVKRLGGETAAGFLRRGLEWFATLGVGVQRVMTGNGSC